jgi:hypothetical protein
VTGVDYENSGLCVSEPESHSNGTLGFEIALDGESGESPTDVEMLGQETMGIFVTGEESALAAAQPRLETYPALPVEGDAPNVFASGLGVVECANTAMTALPSGAFTELQLDASYSYCHVTTEKVYPAEWDMNSCSYVYGLDSTGPPYSGDIDVACDSEGDTIELRTYLSGTPEEHSGLICTLKIGPQEKPRTGVGFSSAFEESEQNRNAHRRSPLGHRGRALERGKNRDAKARPLVTRREAATPAGRRVPRLRRSARRRSRSALRPRAGRADVREAGSSVGRRAFSRSRRQSPQ